MYYVECTKKIYFSLFEAKLADSYGKIEALGSRNEELVELKNEVEERYNELGDEVGSRVEKLRVRLLHAFFRFYFTLMIIF